MAFCLAVCYDHLEIVKYLIEQEADIHANNDSSLLSAAYSGHLDIVKCLVEHGIDIHIHNNEALRWSRNGNCPDVVDYLISQEATA